ncbi:MAG: NAD(P)/FAD-dependent oxidoreductase [Chitinophagaceae bacterium]
MRKRLSKKDYDAVIVGSGPNGLAAAITLQQKGLSVLILEAKGTTGGGLRSDELTLPGFTHDVCSAIHPLAIESPFFNQLPLKEHGVEYIQPTLAAAHPFDDGTAAVLHHSIDETAQTLDEDGTFYKSVFTSLTELWPLINTNVLSPLRFPSHPLAMAEFGMNALKSADSFTKRFSTQKAKGFWAGMSAHSMLPFHKAATSAIAMVLLTMGHRKGWPMIRGGSQQLANALTNYFTSLGGKIEFNTPVTSMQQLPSAHAVLFDVTPNQLLTIAGHTFSSNYKKQLERFRYGAGVFKIDWALSEPVPFTNSDSRKAGTVHIGNTYAEIAAAEEMVHRDIHPEKPFVLFAQQSLFDNKRAPAGKQTAWGYCHVPNGSDKDMTDAIEKQVERFAPGFRDLIIGRHTTNAIALENYNNNYIGGDIGGGSMDIKQLFTRPALTLSPFRTSAKGIYICSSSTPPGGGVHGMCGFNAAKKALKDVFRIK